MLRVFKTPLSSSLVERSLGSIVSLVFVILVLQPLHNTSPVFVSGSTVDAGTISDTGDYGGCGFLHNEARYYTVTSTITLQNVPAGDIFINDGLIRTLRRQLLLAECQIGLAEGVPCPSGTASLPCAQPVYVCKDSGAAENDASTMVTQDVYEAVEDGRCEGGDVNLLVCDMVKQYGPELKELVDNGSCVAQCRAEGNQEGVAVSIDGCMSFDLTLSAPTEQAADVFVEELASTRVKDAVELGLSSFGNNKLIFSVVDASVGPAIGFGFFPPPPPPPPPLKPLTPYPSQSGALNVEGSPENTLEYGEWSECSATCGKGVTTRTVTCTSGEGSLLPLRECSGGLEAVSSKTCSVSCDGPYWRYGPWQTCSETCGTGVSERDALCVSDGTHTCSDRGKEPLVGECNTIPCEVYSWIVSPWSECSASCGGGTQSRQVSCVDESGKQVAETDCIQNSRPSNSRGCNTQPCQFCESTACLGRGLCASGQCQCRDGYGGTNCELPMSCPSGVVDNMLACCASGVVDTSGSCCSEGSRLDGNGSCCNATVDACGECGGRAKYIDIQGLCCEFIDANGVCCESGLIDECGVCNGVDNSCTAVLGVKMQVPGDIISGSEIQDESIYDYFQQVANVSGIDQARISIGRITMAPNSNKRRMLYHHRLLLQDVNSATVVVEVEISPDDADTSDVPFSSAYYAAVLPDASSQYGSKNFQIDDVLTSSTIGMCGNGICEIGEREIIGVSAGSCPQDCGLPSKPCPGGCGQGQCLPASGVCLCPSGYEGDSCQDCQIGYLRSLSTELCVPSVTEQGLVSPLVLGEEGQALVSGSSGGTSAGVIVGAIFGSIAGATLLVLLFICIRRRLQWKTPKTTPQFTTSNNHAYEPDDSDEFGLRKKYGMSEYNFGYDSDKTDRIPTSNYDNLRDSNPVFEQHEPHEQREYATNADDSMIVEPNGLHDTLRRPVSARISYMHGDATMNSSDQNSGFQENLYIKMQKQSPQHHTKGIEEQNPYEYRGNNDLIKSGPPGEHNGPGNANGDDDTMVKTDSGAESLGLESPQSVAQNEIKQIYDSETAAPLNSESRMIYNPAFSMHVQDDDDNAQKKPGDNEQTPTVEVDIDAKDDLDERRLRLDALRAAVRSLESRAPSEQSAKPTVESGSNAATAKPAMGVTIGENLENKKAKTKTPMKSFFSTIRKALTPPRFARQQDMHTVTQSDSSFNRVLEAVNGALQHSENSSPAKISRSRFDAQQYHTEIDDQVDGRPPWH